MIVTHPGWDLPTSAYSTTLIVKRASDDEWIAVTVLEPHFLEELTLELGLEEPDEDVFAGKFSGHPVGWYLEYPKHRKCPSELHQPSYCIDLNDNHQIRMNLAQIVYVCKSQNLKVRLP